MQKVAVLLVMCNEERHIKALSEALTDQSYKNISFFTLDNNSNDNSASLITQYLPQTNLFKSIENSISPF